jgi:glycosyltransferase involved in cell wall biosynthesis
MKLGYFSSYDRGLYYLLKHWKYLQENIPNLTLEICYGWNLYDRSFSEDKERMEWKNMMVGLMKQPGITEHGRVSKEKLDEITAQCQVWAYPCDFFETNCITALNSQKLGVVPVAVVFGGLLDTVYSGVKIEGDIKEEEVQKKFCDELIALSKDPKRLKEESEKAKAGASQFSWENIANEWEKHF